MSTAVAYLPIDLVDSTKATAARKAHVRRRSQYLQQVNQPRRSDMARIRAIMNGGAEGMVALLGRELNDVDDEDRLAIPAANLILSGVERGAHRLGKRPTVRIEPPALSEGKHAPTVAAEKRERIIESFDEQSDLELMLPQVARWLIGYGFAPIIITDGWDDDGYGFPDLEIRDPFDCWPGSWGPKQQPPDVAFVRRVPADLLADMYPDAAVEIERHRNTRWVPELRSARVGSAVTFGAASRWENPTDDGIAVVEYYDANGCTTWSPQCDVILDHEDNPVPGRAMFHVFKRFSFDRPQGQFDQGIGLMASIAKFNLMLQIAMEEAVFSETNIFDDTADANDYEVGRDAVNVLSRDARVEKRQQQIPYQAYQHISVLTDHLRKTTRYSASEDGEAPTSWVTGAGVEALGAGSNAEMDELRLVLRKGLERLDTLRLMYAQARWGRRKMPLVGMRDGQPFVEWYRPDKDIASSYRTRRVYGAMAGWDEPQKIVTGLQLRNARSMSRARFMSNLESIDNVTQEMKAIRSEEAEDMAWQTLQAKAAEGDPAALAVVIGELPDSPFKAALEKFYTPQGEQPSPEEQQMLAGGGMGAGGMPGEVEDVTTLLSRLSAEGDTTAGLQTVQMM